MSDFHRYSGVTTPPPSEDGSGTTKLCPTPPPNRRCHSDNLAQNDLSEVNNSTTITPSASPSTPFPPSPPASIKSRRDRTSSQREANRSKQFTTRLNRSASAGNTTDPLTGRRRKGFQRQTSSLPADHGLKAVEPPHEQALTKMAFAEQQKWITVQQKTFTKWYVGWGLVECMECVANEWDAG